MAKKSLKKRFRTWVKRNFLKYVVIPSTLLIGTSKDNHTPFPYINPKTKREETSSSKGITPEPTVKNASQHIYFSTDTLDTPPFAAAYSSGLQIIRNFVPNDQRYKLSLPILAHEQKHKDNYRKGLRSQKLTPLLYAKMCMHDEISANICEILTMRYEYLAAESEEKKQAIIKKYSYGIYGYYFKAIKDGQIHPEATDEKSRQDEWAFIAQETQKMWMERRFPSYRPCITRMVERYLSRPDSKISPKDAKRGYQKVLDIAYNIGGVDFGKYMKNDISFNDYAIEAMDNISRINLYGGDKKDYLQRVKISLNKFKEQNGALSPEIISHTYIAEGMKMSLTGISQDILQKHPDVISACYNKISSQLLKSSEGRTLLHNTLQQEEISAIPPITETKLSPEELSELYTYKGIDLSKMILGFKENPEETNFFTLDSEPLFEDFAMNTRLKTLRDISPKENSTTTGNTDTPKEQPRRSKQMSFMAPNYNEPILQTLSEEQTQEIYNCIRTFDSIPDVMKGCDLKAQAAYLNKLKSR